MKGLIVIYLLGFLIAGFFTATSQSIYCAFICGAYFILSLREILELVV